MKEFLTGLDYPLLWTIIGSIAGVVGVYLTYRQIRKPTNQGTEPLIIPAVPTLEELDSETEWVDAQVKAINAARYSASLCLHTIHSSSEVWKAQRVNAALADAKSQRGVEVRVLAAINPERLRGAYELEFGLGIDVRLTPEIAHYDLRFLVVDSDQVVLGVANPDREHGKYRQTYSWALLRSSSLCEALEREYQRMWLSPYAVTLSRYCADIVKGAGPLPSAKLASDLGLDYEIAKRFATQPPLSTVMGTSVLVFYGKSCSGKSTLMRALTRDYGANCLDLRDVLLPHIHRYGAEHVADDLINQVHSDLVGFYRAGSYDAIETRADCNVDVLRMLFECIQSRQRAPVLVHCKVSTDIALKRNEHRPARVAATSILRQAEQEEGGAYLAACKRQNVPVLTVVTDTVAAESLSQLMQGVKSLAVC